MEIGFEMFVSSDVFQSCKLVIPNLIQVVGTHSVHFRRFVHISMQLSHWLTDG